MGDLTTNHCGDTHEWFQDALEDPDAPEVDFFFFEEHPNKYCGWWGMKEMPIFDHRCDELRKRLYDGPESVVAKWLGAKGLDAWRIDVANMTGIHGDINLSHEVAITVRRTMADSVEESFLQAESNHDAREDLRGDGYQGTMNYAAFTRPLWQWLLPKQALPYEHGKYPLLPNLPGGQVVAAMKHLSSVVPWQGTLHAMNLIGSHDTHRIISLLEDERMVDVAFGMLVSYPGIPMIYAGDEIGLKAMGPEYARIPMPWNHEENWNHTRLMKTKLLLLSRSNSEALLRGGLRWLCVTDDTLTFIREAPSESVLIHASRSSHQPVRIPTSVIGHNLKGLAGSDDIISDSDDYVTLPSKGPHFDMWVLDVDEE